MNSAADALLRLRLITVIDRSNLGDPRAKNIAPTAKFLARNWDDITGGYYMQPLR